MRKGVTPAPGRVPWLRIAFTGLVRGCLGCETAGTSLETDSRESAPVLPLWSATFGAVSFAGSLLHPLPSRR